MTNTLKESVQFVLNSAIYKQTTRFDIDGNINPQKIEQKWCLLQRIKINDELSNGNIQGI